MGSSVLQLGAGDESAGVRTLIEIAFRHRWTFLSAATLTFLLAILWTFGTSRKYTSEMMLVVQNARTNDSITSGSGAITTTLDVTEEQLNTEIAVLNSDDLLDEVVDPGWTQLQSGSIPHSERLHHQGLVAQMKGKLDVSAIRSSHVISVKFVAQNPQYGHDTLKSLLSAFLAKQSQLGRPPGSSAFFQAQAERYGRELTEARAQLAVYQQTHGFASLENHENTISQKLSDLSSQLRENNVRIRDTQQRLLAGASLLQKTSQRISTTERTATATGAVDQLNTLLVTLTNRRTELLTTYRPEDRLIVQIDQQIADTKAGLERATIEGPHEKSTDLNPAWQALQAEANSDRTKFQGQQAVRIELESQISHLQQELNGSVLLSPEFNSLKEKVADLENQHQLIVEKRDAAEMADLMDRQQWLNVAVIESPTLPLSPSHPQPFKDVFLGMITAVCVGSLAVFLAESARNTVSTSAELDSISRIPVLAVIPCEDKSLTSGAGTSYSELASTADHVA